MEILYITMAFALPILIEMINLILSTTTDPDMLSFLCAWKFLASK